MEGNREQAGQGRRLLVAKGSFESFGGAERDLIRNLPALSEAFEVTVATLAPVSELENMCSELGVSLLYPENTWKMPVDPVSRILDIGSNSATKAWKSCSRLGDAIDHCDAVHLVSGDGSLELLDMIQI